MIVLVCFGVSDGGSASVSDNVVVNVSVVLVLMEILVSVRKKIR